MGGRKPLSNLLIYHTFNPPPPPYRYVLRIKYRYKQHYAKVLK